MTTPRRPGLRARLRDADSGPLLGGWSALLAAVALAVAGSVGLLLEQPWVFPSLGPTLMVLAETPRQPAARPRHVVLGHLVGVLTGYLALVVTGLRSHPSAVVEGLTGARVGAACLSVALTALVLQALRAPHPPAGATTLIVGLGILTSPSELVVLVLSVVLCTAVAVLLDRAVRGDAAAG